MPDADSNFLKNVRRCSYIISFGFDLTGKLKDNQRLTFEDIKLALTPEALTLEGSGPSGMLEYAKGTRERLAEDLWKTLPPYRQGFRHETYESLTRRELYFPSEHNRMELDEFLYRGFLRKRALLTSETNAGFVTVRVLDIRGLELLIIHDEDSSDESDIDQRKTIRLEDYRHFAGFRNVKVRRTVDKLQVDMRFYLQLNLESLQEVERDILKVARVSVLTAVIEPRLGDQDKVAKFLTEAGEAYIDLELVNMPKDIRSLAKEVSDHVLEMELDGKTGKFLQLYDFIIAVAWVRAVRAVREWIRKKWRDERKGKDRYHDGNLFMTRHLELKSYLSFHVKEVVYEDNDGLGWNLKGGKIANEEFLASHDLVRLFELIPRRDMKKRDVVAATTAEFFAKHTVTQEGEILFRNKIVAFTNCIDMREERFYNDAVLDYVEAGSRWNMSWHMLLSQMLCSLSEIFMLYNEEVERHIIANVQGKSKSSKDLRDLSDRAALDFKSYYDVNVVSDESYRETFEHAKKQFGIDHYYTVLKDQLELFSNYEIAEENARLNKRVFVLGAAAVVIALLALLPYLPQIWQVLEKLLGI